MTPSPPAARRLLLLACGSLAALALALPGCGEEETAAQQDAGAQQPQSATQLPDAKRPAAGESASPSAGCPAQLDSFVEELRSLRRRLAVGLSYDQYKAAVEDLRASYAAVPVERLGLHCLSTAGTPAEDALNKYIDGVNAWGECLADAACTTATIEPVLQRKWRLASRHLGEAKG